MVGERSLLSVVIATALLFSASAAAQPNKFDHHGSVGLIGGTGYLLRQSTGTVGTVARSSSAQPIDLGATLAVGENGNEVKLVGRLELAPASRLFSVYGGYRGYSGASATRLFYDLDVAVKLGAQPAVGPRLAFGFQYELARYLGLNLSTGAQGAIGSSLSYSIDVLVGFQIRAYPFR